MGSIMKRGLCVGLAALIGMCMATMCVPANALATPGASVSGKSTFAASDVDTGSVVTYVNGVVYDPDAFRIVSVDNDDPVTSEDLDTPVTVVVANGKGDPSDWSVEWSRHVLGEDGQWVADDAFELQGAGFADPRVDGKNAFLTYDFSKDAGSFGEGDCRYRYYVEVSDGNDADSTYPDDPIEVWPHEKRYVNDPLTDTGRLNAGEWEWRFEGMHLGWAYLNSDGLRSTDDAFGALSKQAMRDDMTIRTIGAGTEAELGTEGSEAAWMLSVTTDSGEAADMFVGAAQMTLDATEWIDGFEVSDYANANAACSAATAAARDLRLLRTMDGESVQSIGWAGDGEPASDSAFAVEATVVDGKVHVLLKFMVKASEPETGRLGCIALAGPKTEGELAVLFEGSAVAVDTDEALPSECSISPKDEQFRSSGQRVRYTVGVAEGWNLKGYAIDGREIVEGDVIAGAGVAGNTRAACVKVSSGDSGRPKAVGVMGINFIEIDVDRLASAWEMAGDALEDGSKVSVVAQFETREQPPVPPEPVVKGPVLKLPVVEHGYAEVSYFAAKLDESGKPVLDEGGEVVLIKKAANTKDDALAVEDIMPGTEVTVKFCPTGDGQYAAGYDKGDEFVRGKVLVSDEEASLVNGALDLPNYGLDAHGDLLEGQVPIEYAFGPGQDEPGDHYTVCVQIMPGVDGKRHGEVVFEGTNDTKQDVVAGSRVVFEIRPDEQPAPGYVPDRVVMVQHAQDALPDESDGKDVTRHVADGRLTIDSLDGVGGGGDVITLMFHFKVAPVTLTVPDGLEVGEDGEILGIVSPVGEQVIPEGDKASVAIKPAVGSELNPAAQLVLRGKDGKSAVVPVSDLGKSFDDFGNPAYELSVGYVDAVSLGGQVELTVQDGPLFMEKKAEPDAVCYRVTAETKFETVDGVKGAGAVSISDGAEKVESGGRTTLYLMPEIGSKVTGVCVVDKVNGKERVRDFGAQPVQAVTEFLIANVVSDTHVVVTFAPVSEGEEQGGLTEDQVDVITVCQASDVAGKGEVVSPEPGSTLTLPRGASKRIVLKPAEGWEVGRIVLGGEVADGRVVGGTVLAYGAEEYTYRAVGGIRGVLHVEFVESVSRDDPAGSMFEVSVIDADVEIVDMEIGAEGGMTEADFDEYVSVDVVRQRVKRGESVSFALTLKDVRGDKGYYALYDVIANNPADGVAVQDVNVTALREDAAMVSYSERGDAGAARRLFGTFGLMRSGLVSSPAGEYLVTIPNVQSDLDVEIRIAEMDPDSDDPEIRDAAVTPPSERNIPDWFTLTATSQGGGYVLPLCASWNSDIAEADRARMKVHDVAGDDAARWVEFVPFAGSYLKSVYVQMGSYVGGKWVAASGEAGKVVNVFSRVLGNRLDVRKVFEVLDVGRGAHVRMLATFAQIGTEGETVGVTWNGAFATGDDGRPSSTELECTVTPSLGDAGHVTMLPINREQTFVFDVSEISTEAPYGWILDHLLVNDEEWPPLPGKGYVTLPMDTDMEIVATFRPAKEGERPEPPISYEMTSEQPDEGGVILIGGSAGSVSVIAGQSQTVDFVADDPTDDYEWILDEVMLDGVRLIPWSGEQTLPDGFAFDRTAGVGTTAAGEHFELDYGSGTLTVDGVAASHKVGASFARAVDLRVVCDTTNGLVTPRGDFKWRVGVERTANGSVRKDANGREVLVPESLTVYVAPYEGNELASFDVNGTNEVSGLKTPSDGKGALARLRSEHAALQIGSAGGSNESAGTTLGANWATLAIVDAAAEVANDGADGMAGLISVFSGADGKAILPEFGDIRAYELTADDLTRDGKRVTTVRASFGEPQNGDNATGYTVKATVVNGHGKVNGQDSVVLAVKEGDAAHLRFSSDAGYVVKQVRDNKEVRTDYAKEGYTIADVHENHEVEVIFGLPNTLGSGDPMSRTIRRITAMAKTGDLALPLMFVALGVALAAAGVAVLAGKRRRKS